MNPVARPSGDQARRNAGPDAPYSSASRECQICSYSQRDPDRRGPVYHRHFSSIFLRRLTGVESSNNPSHCPSCMIQHIPYPQKRLKIVISDSTLHHFFAPPGCSNSIQYPGDMMHIDYLTIAGADLKALTDAFLLEYLTVLHQRPMDIVVVAGYNDIVEGYSRHYIVERLHYLVDCVLHETRAKKLPPHEGHTMAVATLMFPPQLAWLAANGPVPYEGYQNNWDKIEWINQEIRDLNLAYDTKNPPQFHTYGLRTCTRSNVDRYGNFTSMKVRSHRWEHWREPNPADMLHLNNERRFKMAVAINNYFKFNTLN